MGPAGLGLIGAGVGALKSELFDKGKEARQRELAAQTALYSPWTGMQPQAVQEADTLGAALQGGLAGAQFGQAAEKAENEKELLRIQSENLRQQQLESDKRMQAFQPQQTPNTWQNMYAGMGYQRG